MSTFKEPKFDLWAMYHPGGFPITERDGASEPDTCPCGCKDIRCRPGDFWVTAEKLGIKGTPGQLAIAEEKAKVRSFAPKPRQTGVSRPPWKGATVAQGEVSLPDANKQCGDADCELDHGYVRKMIRVHRTEYPAQVYTLPNDATAKVRIDKGGRIP